MSDKYDAFNQSVLANTVCQNPSLFELSTISTMPNSTTLYTVPYHIPIKDPRVYTYCPMYPCPHKDLFHIARQIDKLPVIECEYQYDSCTFKIRNTENNRTLGILGKDTKANQIILQCDSGYSDRFIRLITLDLDCDLLALVQMDSHIRGLYRVNSAGDA